MLVRPLRVQLLPLLLIPALALLSLPSPTFATGELCTGTAADCCVPPDAVVRGGGCLAGQVWIGDAAFGSCQTPASCSGGERFLCANNSCFTGPSLCADPLMGLEDNAACCPEDSVPVRGALGWSCVDSTTLGGSPANVFETFNAPSGTDPVADSATDTLNFTAGSGITITGDSSTDSITIAATGGSSLWTANGNKIYYNTDNVGIGNSDPTYKLDIGGTTRATEFIATGIYGYRQTGQGSNDMLHYHDTGNYYMLLSDAQYGGYNTLRPFRLAKSSGDIALANNTSSFSHSTGNVSLGSGALQILNNSSTTAKYLYLSAQDGTNEGGEIQLQGAGAYNSVVLDNYQGNARMFNFAAGKQLQLLGVGIAAANNADVTSYLGRAAIGFAPGLSDYASFAHVDQNNSTGYAMIQESTGNTFLNRPAGSAMFFREGNANQMYLEPGGELGIGNTAPGYKLDVTGGIRGANLISTDIYGYRMAGYTQDLLHYIDSNDYYMLISNTPYGGYNTARPFRLRRNTGDLFLANGSIMAAHGTGNLTVGFGGDNGYKLDVNGTTRSNSLILRDTGSVFNVENQAVFQAKNSGGAYEPFLWPRWADNVTYINYGSGGFNIRNNSSALTMFMDNGGNVGIGMVPSAAKLQVDGATYVKDAVNGTGYNYGVVGTATNNGGGLWAGLRGIGTTAHGIYATSVSGYAGLFTKSTDSNTVSITDTNGACTINPGAGAAWSCSSDRKLKKDIKPLIGGLDVITQLKPSSFKMKVDDSQGYGFIAQEVQEVIPHLVSVVDEKDGTLGVAEAGMIPYMVNAIKELKAENDGLKVRLKALEKK